MGSTFGAAYAASDWSMQVGCFDTHETTASAAVDAYEILLEAHKETQSVDGFHSCFGLREVVNRRT